MKRNVCIGGVASGALLLSAGLACAQESAPKVRIDAMEGPPMFMLQQGDAPPMPGPEAGNVGFFAEGVELLGFGGPHGGKVVTGSPFTATAISETTQTLADGNRITRKTQSSLYRDSHGRFRKEVSLSAIGPLAASGQPRSFIVIHDPVAGTSFVLEQEEKIARKLPSKLTLPPGAEATKDQPEYHVQAASQDTVKTESLGTQQINGMTAEGTRMTRTIAPGQIGNELPITIVSETWYSNDLKMTVMSKRSDPRFGETTYTLSNIQRTEPDASLFTVPSDYNIQEGGPRTKRFHFEAPAAPPSN
jgi:hypothetical protein